MVAGLVLLNLVLTFAVPSISVGAHVGGLLAGGAAAMLVSGRREHRGRIRDAALTLLLAAALLAAAVTIARDIVRVLTS